MLTLIAIFLHPAPLITDNSSDLHEKDKDEEDDKEVQRVLHASDSFDLNSMRLRSRRLKSK